MEGRVTDATENADLLEKELAFSETLAGTLVRLQALRQTLDVIQRAIIDDRPLEAVEALMNVDMRLSSASGFGTARVAEVLRSRVADFTEEATEKLAKHWNEYIHFDAMTRQVRVSTKVQGRQNIILSIHARN